MNQHYFRGNLLLEQGRFDLALEELREAVTLNPDESIVYASLAMALLRSGRSQEAVAAAETALAKDPNETDAHWAMALVRLERNELKPAEKCIRQAIELDPFNASFRGLLARVLCETKRFDEALKVADEGLAIEASDELCLTFRARALMALGRKGEAALAADTLLAEGPEDAWNHCLRGDQLLTGGDAASARVHYLEALRIEPGNTYARNCLATSLKARSPLYGLILKLLIRLQTLRTGALWAALIGLFFAMRFGDAWALRHPDWLVPYEALKQLFLATSILVVIANPVFNLLLRLDQEGKHALSPDETRATNWFLACLAFGALCAAWTWSSKGSPVPRTMAMASFVLCTAVAEVFEASPGYVRRRMAALTGLAATCLVLTPALFFFAAFLVFIAQKQLAIRVLTVAFWVPLAVTLFTMFAQDIRHWLEKRRPDPIDP